MQVQVHGGLLELSRSKKAKFAASRVSAKEGELAGWNICRFSILSTRQKGDARNEDALDCSYITLKPSRSGHVEMLRHKILQLRYEYVQAERARVEARRAAQANMRPPGTNTSGSAGSPVSSGGQSFVGLPRVSSTSTFGDIFNDTTNQRLELDGSPHRAELDGATPQAGSSRRQPPPSTSTFGERLRRTRRRRRSSQGNQNLEE